MNILRKSFVMLMLLACQVSFGPRLLAQSTAFAKGADVGWLTQMEASGRVFYNAAGTPQDLFQILRDYDMNTIRLRVWVNPAGGWNGKNDVIAKAIRAHRLGFRLMIDFHYSDSWADPGQQTKPAAWAGLPFAQLKTALYNHTYDVLDSLKDNNIVPEWVQVGNETNDGMLWPDGRRSTNPQNFAALIDAGYAAVKAVNPSSKVIVHISNGYDSSLFRSVFDGLAASGARYDVIGMSLYPTTANWPTLAAQCQANMNDMVSRYPGKEVMVVEVGMPANAPIPTRQLLLDLMGKVRAVPAGKGLGVLYWEPEAYNWMGYGLAAWASNGQPTAALDAFRNVPPTDGLVFNPGFEYTAATQTPLGWSTSSAADADADFTQSYGQASLFQLAHQKATAYRVRTYQLLNGVPNGTYTLRAWAQSSGGQAVCQLYANGYGGPELNTDIAATNGRWVRIQVPNITVTNGQCEIGLRSDAHAGESASLDDVEFVSAQATATNLPATTDALSVDVFPNPAGSECRVQYTLTQPETVHVTLCSLDGRQVLPLGPAQRLAAGPHTLVLPWDGLAPGLYILKISHDGQQITRKISKE